MKRFVSGFARALVMVALGASFASAGNLQPPPDVDLDPDRGMTFGRMPKTSLPGQIYGPTKQALRKRYMDPSVDPYMEMQSSGRYEPATGRISGSLTDARRTIKRREEASRSRKERDASPAGVPLRKD
jgi:hypothetical protein